MTTDESGYEHYLWIADSRVVHDYTMFFVRGLDVSEVFRRLGVDASTVRMMTEDERRMGSPFISVHALDGWTLVIEPDGFDSFTEHGERELSMGTEVVAVNSNVLAHARFRHFVDGEMWTMFDAVEPDYRHGTHPDRLVEPMRRLGLDPDPRPDTEDDDQRDDSPFHWREQNLALAEHVTGIRLVPEMLRDAAPSAPSPFRSRDRAGGRTSRRYSPTACTQCTCTGTQGRHSATHC